MGQHAHTLMCGVCACVGVYEVYRERYCVKPGGGSEKERQRKIEKERHSQDFVLKGFTILLHSPFPTLSPLKVIK